MCNKNSLPWRISVRFVEKPLGLTFFWPLFVSWCFYICTYAETANFAGRTSVGSPCVYSLSLFRFVAFACDVCILRASLKVNRHDSWRSFNYSAAFTSRFRCKIWLFTWNLMQINVRCVARKATRHWTFGDNFVERRLSFQSSFSGKFPIKLPMYLS